MSAASHEGAQRDPFALTASADDYVPSEAVERARRQAVASLSEGRVPVIAGPTGLGKTLTLQLVGRDCADRCQPVYVPYCSLSPDELASLVLGLLEWDRATDPEIALLDAARRAAESGNRLLLLVDDAASLPGDTAAQLAHWLNASGGALQMALAGLPGAALRHVRDAFGDQGEEVRLEGGLRPDEIPGYVRSRLEAAGAEPTLRSAFDDAALAELARVSGGNPRRLNLAAQAIVRSVYDAGPPTLERRARATARAERPAAPPPDAAPTPPGASGIERVGAYRFVRGRFVDPKGGGAPEAESVWREPLRAREPSGERAAPMPVPEEIDAGLGMAYQPGAGSDPAAAAPGEVGDDERLAPRLEPPPTRRGKTLRAIALGVGAVAFAIGMWSQLGGPAQAPSPAPPDAAPRAQAPAPRQATAVEPAMLDARAATAVEPAMSETQTAEAGAPAPTAQTLPTTQTEGEAVLPETPTAAQAETPPAPSLEPVAPLAAAPPVAEPDVPPAPASIAPDTAPVPEPVAPPAETVAIAINATPWAVIEIDGEEVGETPLAGIRLPTGRHRFRARMPDGTVRERVVRIDASTPTVVFE